MSAYKTQRASSAILQEMLDFGISKKQIAEDLGCSSDSITTWVRKNDMPARLAAKATHVFKEYRSNQRTIRELALPKPKTYKSVSSKSLSDYMTKFGTSSQEVAAYLGVSQGTIHKWLRENRMPMAVGRAIDGLKPSSAPPLAPSHTTVPNHVWEQDIPTPDPEEEVTLLVVIKRKRLHTFNKLCSMLGVDACEMELP